MDQAFVATGQDLIEAHERLWKLFRTVTEQLVEWRCLAFAKFSAGLALERAAEWQREASRLEERLPDAHPVLQACTRAIGAFQQVLPLLQALGSPLLTAACWREIFAAMGVKCPAIAQLTLGQLLSYPLLEHRDPIFKVWSNERGRWHTTDTLRRLQKTWAEKQLRVVNFILHVPYQAPEHAHRPREPARVEHVPKDSGTFVLSDTTELRALAEKSLLRLQSIVLSPHATDVRDEAETLATTLQTFDTTELRALAEKSLLRLQSIVLSPHATDVRDEAETLATTLQTFGESRGAGLLKYRVALPPAQAPGPAWAGEAPGCWAEVLDQRLHYDYEYVGPAARPVGGPQLERSFLGLLLALDEFRCACLLLEELDQLAPGVLAGFGQLTADLQALCLALREGPCSVEEDEDLEEEAEEKEEEKGTSPEDTPEALALPELGVDEAQPFQPRILGHILFGDRLLRVRETFGCLATLRQVPATMRLALRPVALLPPDVQAVAELALLAAGFREASRLAHKLATFFRLEGELGPGPGPSRLALLKG
ncbi:dynein heavy chain domain-containing protein 1-like, partial [Alligator sinensis]|uniref:Dynein heavy chain domain-containing protein 1-like n=1 Tax=Alligator sinensis TaxID=38654 RepID=A0A3Q0FTM7_ALLSI